MEERNHKIVFYESLFSTLGFMIMVFLYYVFTNKPYYPVFIMGLSYFSSFYLVSLYFYKRSKAKKDNEDNKE